MDSLWSFLPGPSLDEWRLSRAEEHDPPPPVRVSPRLTALAGMARLVDAAKPARRCGGCGYLRTRCACPGSRCRAA